MDYGLAAVWFRKAAWQDQSEAQFLLGNMLALGQGLPKDRAQA